MAYLAISRDNRELMFNESPEYDRIDDCWRQSDGEEIVYNDYADFSAGIHREDKFFYGIELPKGTIRKLIDRELAWEDEPVELKGE